jgi:hypothetical protein
MREMLTMDRRKPLGGKQLIFLSFHKHLEFVSQGASLWALWSLALREWHKDLYLQKDELSNLQLPLGGLQELQLSND